MSNLLIWSVRNSPAINSTAIAILLIGGWCAFSLQREFWPHVEVDIIDVIIDYPGATPREVEASACENVEEVARNIAGVRRVSSTASAGRGVVSLQLQDHLSETEIDEILNRVRNRVDRIRTIPADAERPIVQRRPQMNTTMQIGVVGRSDDSIEHELQLREVAEQVRMEVLRLPAVSDAVLSGSRQFQIDVELSEGTVRAHGVTLRHVANRIRAFSEEVAGGVIRSEGHEFILRGQRHGLDAKDLESIPLVASDSAAERTVGQLGSVKDTFADETCISRINGRAGVVIRIDARESDDILDVGHQVHRFVNAYPVPPGFELVTLMDRTDDVASRLDLMARNGWQGLLLVLILLSLLMDFRLAFWVAAGIPVALAGAAATMYALDQSLNMSSMFAFLIAIGIVVDDAIIVSENIAAHRQMGKSAARAAVDGCREVMPAVVTSVLTTSIAFLPILLMTGRAGRMAHVLPLAVIAILAFSLVEALIFLPSHLAGIGKHRSTRFTRLLRPLAWMLVPHQWIAKWMKALLEALIARVYLPSLRFCLGNAPLVICMSLGALIVAIGAVANGAVPFSLLPKMDWNFCSVAVKFPDGTPKHVTDAATLELERSLDEIRQELIASTGEDPIRVVHRTVGFASDASGEHQRGSHIGGLSLQLIDSSKREISSQQLISRWRANSVALPGVTSTRFSAGPAGIESPAIEFMLMATRADAEQLNLAVEQCLRRLQSTPGIQDVATDLAPGKHEFRVRLHEDAGSSGITMGQIARTLRGVFHGEEAIRVQRGRHEVPIRVRYAKHERDSLRDLRRVTLRAANGIAFPIAEFADIHVVQGVSEIHRRDQMRAVTIEAEVDSRSASHGQLASSIEEELTTTLESRFPGVQFVWDGQRQETRQSMKHMRYAFLAVLVAMYVLLTLQFRSYQLPLLVLVIVPFSMIGAIAGHHWLGMNLTLFSAYGMVSLAGIVVNDSIVLIDFINQRVSAGVATRHAIMDAGRRRFRPIILTSLTTIVCLIPVMSDTSRQGQVLAPMAVSVAFGLMVSTILVLLVIPSIYSLIAVRNKQPCEYDHMAS